ncbi:anaerobic ribonucleoside-triphosphate reductase activating protein [Alphaproteobacteria bacterium]|nr:anaerobic ribonucleoside-triphosphate reductase activating protein [Alphaproteobacteria bacterium]
MNIGGFIGFSTLDYPGKLSAVIFCQGCPARCPYCHNQSFQSFDAIGVESFEKIFQFLASRKGLLDAVVFSGGEPLVHSDLIECIQRIKNIGYLIGVHTSGIAPSSCFNDMLYAVDWVGFDLKTSFEQYDKITNLNNSGELAKRNFLKLAASGVNCEIRTTFHNGFVSEQDLFGIAKILIENKIENWVIQECVLRSDFNITKIPLPNSMILNKIKKNINVILRMQ